MVATSDRTKLEEELNALDGRRQELDAALRDAQNRQRYSHEPPAVDQAKAEEAALMKELDQLMTRYRALEGRLLLAQSGQKTPW
jgi:predicted  nucleic acid-binding Zn-ribbon protein